MADPSLSAEPVAAKLLIKPGSSVWISPSERLELLAPLPDGIRAVTAIEDAHAAILFADDAGSLRRSTASVGASLREREIGGRDAARPAGAAPVILGLGSIGMGIGATGVATGMGSIGGVIVAMVAWGAIATVNLAHALRR
jgi:hypothetical protein